MRNDGIAGAKGRERQFSGQYRAPTKNAKLDSNPQSVPTVVETLTNRKLQFTVHTIDIL